MEIDIVERKENPAVKREELKFKVDHMGNATPTRSEVKAKIAAEEDLTKSLLVIDSLKTKTGLGITEGYAKVYTRMDDLKEIEQDHIVERNVNEKKDVEEESEE
ncbi:Ribosomal protein S24E [Methanonatronarchaeum thermophilum]|uniref:Small ribosomal subunit protein eS24 n=2 Tax=Methanonatronarchaeum thermophilum TaxID=1927129 RepID=A0A1Y3GB40_9EURY|nr:30S ribosomal protein S24e [Methanonatronarchaeum thermophilum]OUJ18638.1 Ribosomal protein S24E [Methanonatronarchaeum thermophilum]